MQKEKLSTKVRKEAVRMKYAWDAAMNHLYQTKLMGKVKMAMVGCMSAWMYLCSTGLTTYASMLDGQDTAKSTVITAIGAIVKIFPLIGAFFIVSGVFKLVMAYRNNNPEDQSTAAKDIVIGAVFVGFSMVWNPVADKMFGDSGANAHANDNW